MKTKCRTLKVSLNISFISLCLFTMFFFLDSSSGNVWYKYFYNISLGLFGSSFVVLLITIPEYRVAKIQLLERIWNESRILNIQLHKIRPLHSYVDSKILVNYIHEWSIKQDGEIGRFFNGKHDAYDKIYNYTLKFYKETIKKIKKEDIKEYVDSLINTEREKILKQLEKTVDQYINLDNYSFQEFNNLLGEVQFFKGTSELVNLYNNIYNPLRNMYNDLKGYICYHCSLYRNGESNNASALLEIIFKNQAKLFKMEKKSDAECEWDIFFSYFCDNMDDRIEEFRAKTIYQCEEQKNTHEPIEAILYNKKEM